MSLGQNTIRPIVISPRIRECTHFAIKYTIYTA
jgi:hypothetical protein